MSAQGDDADEFNPSRFTDAQESVLAVMADTKNGAFAIVNLIFFILIRSFQEGESSFLINNLGKLKH